MSKLFDFFNAMNSGDYDFVDELTDNEVKEISPFVMTQWVNGAQSNPTPHLIMTSHLVVDKIFTLSKHPRLLLKLFITANAGFGYTRFKHRKSASLKDGLTVKCVMEYYRCNEHRARQRMELLSVDDIKEIRELAGKPIK